VTEKVHGANFCIIAAFDAHGGPVVHFAKRTAILGGADDAEDFYSCRSTGLLRELAPRGEAVLRHFAAGPRGDAVQAVHIYGELFGGAYPHADVPKPPGIEPVQMGIWYAPDLQFMAFDVALETQAGRAYTSFDLARQACMDCGLLFAEPLFRGSLAECLDFEIEFETTIPSRLGLPPLLPGDTRNLAEGVVLRPQVEPARSSSQARVGKESLRGLFKRKIPQFSEKRYQNDDWKRGKAGGGGRGNSTVNEEELAGIEIAAMVTEQRLASVLSKIGRVDPKDKEACRSLLEDLKQDVRESLDASDLEVLGNSTKLEADLDAWCRALITQELRGSRRVAS